MTVVYTYTVVVRDPASGKTLGVLRSDNMTIPRADDNADWRAFLAWNATQQSPLDTGDGSPTARKPRTLLAILTDLQALTAAQRTNVAADLFGAGNRWSTDAGPNAGALLALY